MGENVQQENDDLLIHSEYANVSVTLFFHISKMPELGGRPGYIYRTISMVDEARSSKSMKSKRKDKSSQQHIILASMM